MDPSAPELETVIPFEGWITDMSVKDNRLIVANGDQGFSVFDITDSAAPLLLTEIPFPEGTRKVVSDGSRVFSINGNNDLVSIQVDDCVEWSGNGKQKE